MTDIVERLRNVVHPGCRPLVREAADEIERLLAELGQVREILNDREAEIERLRALALKFLYEQTEANADALRAACEVRQ